MKEVNLSTSTGTTGIVRDHGQKQCDVVLFQVNETGTSNGEEYSHKLGGEWLKCTKMDSHELQ